MINLITASTIIKIRPLNAGLTPTMIYEIQQLNRISESELLNNPLVDEAKQLEKEIEESYNIKELNELMEKRINNREKIEELKAQIHKGYGFNISLNIGDTPESIYYYFYVNNRIAPKEEIDYLIERIKQICNGIQLEITYENYKLDDEDI